MMRITKDRALIPEFSRLSEDYSTEVMDVIDALSDRQLESNIFWNPDDENVNPGESLSGLKLEALDFLEDVAISCCQMRERLR